MGAYGVQTVGIKSGLSGLATHYEAADGTVCRGTEGFSALVTIQTLLPSVGERCIAGTLNAAEDAGWAIRRNADTVSTEAEYEVLVMATALLQLTIPISLPQILGRSLLLGFTYDAGELIVYVNGGAAATVTGVAPYVPSIENFLLGSDPSGANGTIDRLISFAYLEDVISASDNARLWNAFRETGSLRVAGEIDEIGGFAYSYEASDISAPPTLTHPATWPNGGAVLAGDLAWAGAANAAIEFSVDSDPDYTMAVSQIVP